MTRLASLRRSAALLFGALALCCAPAAHAQAAEISPAGKAAILASPGVPFAGAKAAKVTVVEYLDFNCPYCKREAPILKQLIAADPNVRVLYKDWPIFGGASVYAAKAALAAGWQGRYLQAHDALISAPSRLSSQAEVRDRLKTAGVDLTRLDRDLASHRVVIDAMLKRNDAEARRLAFQGTPGLVVGGYVVAGGLGLDDLRKLATASGSTPAAKRR